MYANDFGNMIIFNAIYSNFLIREKRLQEWKALKKKQKFGELREISGNQYVNEVTNAAKDVWVVIHLYRSR